MREKCSKGRNIERVSKRECFSVDKPNCRHLKIINARRGASKRPIKNQFDAAINRLNVVDRVRIKYIKDGGL